MFPLVPVPSTRYPSASALLVDESFQLFIKILRGHVQGMFVYTPPSWHPVLCSATPSRPGAPGGGRAAAPGEFHSQPLPGSQALLLPPGIHSGAAGRAGRGPETFPETFPVLLPFAVCPHLPPSLPLTNSQELEQGQLHALGIQTQGSSPGTLPEGTFRAFRKLPVPMREFPVPSSQDLWEHFWVLRGVMDTARESSGTSSSTPAASGSG